MPPRLRDFWYYHKWKVLVEIAVLALLISTVSSWLEESREPWLEIAVMNARLDSPEAAQALSQGYIQARGLDPQTAPVHLETGLYHPNTAAVAEEFAAASIQKYQTMLINGYVDVTVTTQWVVDAYAENGCWMDLRQILPAQTLAAVEDRLHYVPGDGGPIPVGILARDLEPVGRWYPEDPPILTVSAFSRRDSAATDFLLWLLDPLPEADQ